MDTIDTTNPGEGAGGTPAAGSEPQGSTPTAISGGEHQREPATGGATDSTGSPSANQDDPDAAFKELMDRTYDQGVEQPKNDEHTPPNPQADGDQAAQDGGKPEQKPAGDRPQADPAADIDPTAQETKEGRVPLKKLHRALEVRREALTKAEALTKELEDERKITDKLIDHFDHAGIPEESIVPLLRHVAASRKGDENARMQVLQALGIEIPQPQQVSQGIPMEDVEELVELMARSTDPEFVLARFKARHAKNGTTTEAPPKPAASQQQPPARTQQQPPPRPQAENPQEVARVALAHARGKLNDLEISNGRKFVDAVFPRINSEYQAELNRLRTLEVPITAKVATRVYDEVQGRILAQERRARTAPPPTHQKPSAGTGPTIDPNDPDAEFKMLMAKTYGT